MLVITNLDTAEQVVRDYLANNPLYRTEVETLSPLNRQLSEGRKFISFTSTNPLVLGNKTLYSFDKTLPLPNKEDFYDFFGKISPLTEKNYNFLKALYESKEEDLDLLSIEYPKKVKANYYSHKYSFIQNAQYIIEQKIEPLTITVTQDELDKYSVLLNVIFKEENGLLNHVSIWLEYNPQ